MRLDLKTRLLLIISLTVFLTSMAIFWIAQELFGHFIYQRFEEKMNFLSQHLANNITLGLLLQDKDLLKEFARSVLKEQAVVGIKIYDSHNKEIVSLGNPEKASHFIKKEVSISASQAPFQESGTLGYIELYYSTYHLSFLLKRLVLRVLLVSIFLSIFMGFLGYFLITRAFLRPFNELLQAVRKVEKGHLDVFVSGHGLPETETLAKAFSQMLSSLKESQEELKKTYQKMLLQQTMAEIGRFSLIIAHEIKNPLGIIKGSLDILRKREVPPEIKLEMMDYIEEEVRRLDQLIQNFLIFARPKKFHFIPINFEKFLKDFVKKVSLENKLKVELEADLSSCEIYLDPDHLEQALLNLVKNAVEVGAKKITILAFAKGKNVIIRVEDDGPGIPQEIRDKIFEPFFTTKAKGTGLGLCVVAQVIEAHGGKIKVLERKPQGTIFELSIPIRTPEDNQRGGKSG